MTNPTFTILSMLSTLSTRGPMRASEMVKFGHVKMSTATLAYNKKCMLAGGLIEDRAFVLHITPEGESYLKKFVGKVYEYGHIVDFICHEVNESGKIDCKAMTSKYRKLYPRVLPLSEATIRETVRQLKKTGRLEVIDDPR